MERAGVRMEKVNLAQKFSLFTEQYRPKIVGEVNDAYVKLVKLQGDFMWHHHDNEDELFLVVKGALHMRVRENGSEHALIINPGEFIIIPRGVEHFPSAEEPRSTPATSRANAPFTSYSGSSLRCVILCGGGLMLAAGVEEPLYCRLRILH
jgi:mannose-6-phosphate isomerase-like protein (cupin superfamily)